MSEDFLTWTSSEHLTSLHHINNILDNSRWVTPCDAQILAWQEEFTPRRILHQIVIVSFRGNNRIRMPEVVLLRVFGSSEIASPWEANLMQRLSLSHWMEEVTMAAENLSAVVRAQSTVCDHQMCARAALGAPSRAALN